MSIAVIVIALVLMMMLTLKKVPVPVAALISIAVMAIFTGCPVLTTLSGDYMEGMGAFIQANWILLLMGCILSKVMDMTGAASAISSVIIDKLGAKLMIPAIIIAGAVLAYGGINGLALCFALYPIILDAFKKANFPRQIIPAVLVASLFTWVMITPGSPVICNAIASQMLGTSSMSAPVIGFIAAGFVLIYSIVYFNIVLKKAAAKKEGFVSDQNVEQTLARAEELKNSGNLPNVLLALVPLVAIVICYNVVHLELWVSMLVGTILCLVLLYKNINGLLGLLSQAVTEGSIMTVTAASVVGIGNVINAIPGFSDLMNGLVSAGVNSGAPLVIFAAVLIVLSFLFTAGMTGLQTALTVMSEPLMNMGVSAVILHRIGIVASAVLDCVPYAGGIVALFTMTGISYKDGYKHVFMVSIIPMFLAVVISVVIGSVMY